MQQEGRLILNLSAPNDVTLKQIKENWTEWQGEINKSTTAVDINSLPLVIDEIK